MKIFSRLFTKKVTPKTELPTPQQVEQVFTNATEKLEETGRELAEAVKAIYFTRTATSKNGGTVTMKFNSETGKLKSWKRQNPDGTETKGRINDTLAPFLRQSLIEDGDVITYKTIGRLGDTSEVVVQKYDVSEYPRIVLQESNRLFVKGQKQAVKVAENTQIESMPEFIRLSKEDYKGLFQ